MTSPSRRPADRQPTGAGDAARMAVDVGSDRQAIDIVLIDVHEVSGFADYLVIMSAGNPRQMNAIASELEEAIEREGPKLHHREGNVESGWVLLDFGDVVVHLFSPAQREFYKLEQVWRSGRELIRVQ